MKFKLPKYGKEFQDAPLLLKMIFEDADDYCIKLFDKELTVTRVLGTVEGDSGVHADHRAIDCRNEYLGNMTFTEDEITNLLAYINDKYKRNDNYVTLIHHSFHSAPKHFHFQISELTKTYMNGAT